MKVITVNKKAFFDYEILEKLEAGISLVGSEVKSLREGHISLRDAYVEFHDGRPVLRGANISIYPNASFNNHEPERDRFLLLGRQEIRRLMRKVEAKGVTIIPLRCYFSDKGIAKVEIGLAKGKREYEKKARIKERDLGREMDRDLAGIRRR